MHVSIMGDSISTYGGAIPEGYKAFYDEPTRERNGLDSVRDTWWMQVLQTLEADLLVNNSYSGSQVAGDEFPCASGMRRTGALAAPLLSGIKTPTVASSEGTPVDITAPLHPDGQSDRCADGIAIRDRFACSVADTDAPNRLIAPDLVLVYIGVNDFGFAVPCNREYAESPDEPTFYDAYLTMIRRIQGNYPQARIVCATILTPRMVQDPVWSFDEKWSDRTPLSEFNERIRKAASETGALLADLANRAGDMRYDTIDGLHPNKEGHKQMAGLWIDELERLGIHR